MNISSTSFFDFPRLFSLIVRIECSCLELWTLKSWVVTSHRCFYLFSQRRFFIPCSLKSCWRLLTGDMTRVTSSLSGVLGRMWTFRVNCLWVTHHVYKSQLLERSAVRNPISPVLTPTNRMFLLIPEPLPILSTVQTRIYNFIYLTLIVPSGII